MRVTQVAQAARIDSVGSVVTRPDVVAYVGLGSNVGDSRRTLEWALDTLARVPGIRDLRASSLYGSAPLDADGGDYTNAVAMLQTTLSAPQLLCELQAIERLAGRERPYRNAPRTLDLDLLLYGDAQVQSPALIAPHPRMWERAFVVLPLQELAPGLVSAAQRDAVAHQPIWSLPPDNADGAMP